MKLKLSVCVLIMLALVAFGLGYGTVSGFADDRAQVMALLEGENGLGDVLSYRAADGLNLCVVARRHLAQGDVAPLELAARELLGAQTVEEYLEKDAALTNAVTEVSRRLAADAGFAQSTRDVRYLDMLTADMQNLSASAAVTTYNAAAADFNAQLDAPLFGALAKLLGIKPCTLYQ